MSQKSKPEWLSGFYPPVIYDWDKWRSEWSMGPHAEPDWVWFDDYYTETEARERIRTAIYDDRMGG